MKIELKQITVRDLVNGYRDEGDDSDHAVRGYGGKLDIRPAFQRAFVYQDKERNAVIETLRKSFPLNVMYWASLKDGRYEIIDGQQRTVSIARYVNNKFSVRIENDALKFHNLQIDQQEQIMGYKLQVYICDGTDSEKLDWFKTINIAGKQLTNQELRNAVYAGPWVSDAKRWFSKRNGWAYGLGKKYVSGEVNRQRYLETAILWHKAPEEDISDYMSDRQGLKSANELRDYFEVVIRWVEATFPKYNDVMKGIPWGDLYREHKDKTLQAEGIEAEVAELMERDGLTSRAGIYPYVLSDRTAADQRHLNIRAFSKAIKRRVYNNQGGTCKICGNAVDFEEAEADHIDPWIGGGETVFENCQVLCRPCNRRKGAK